MVGAVRGEDILRHIAVIVGTVILLIMLPSIIVSLWNSMTLGQHLGIAVICIVMICFISATQRRSRKATHRRGSL
jgi:low affinity Fe/Cu permease